jgi:hypothetical protein
MEEPRGILDYRAEVQGKEREPGNSPIVAQAHAQIRRAPEVD